jgi:GTP-binding protein
VSRPRVLLQKDETGEKLEPIEEVVIDVDEEHSGIVVQKMSSARPRWSRCARRAATAAAGVPRPDARPDRLPVELLTDTRGTGVMNRLFHAYEPYKGEIPGRITAC